MDIFEEDNPRGNAPEFTVSEISGAIKRVVEGEFAHVRVRGEIGRVSRPASGHIYLDLKDARAVLNGVIWKGAVRNLGAQPEEGLEVIATGRLTTFAGQSRYQIVIESLAPAGAGALMAMLEKRRKALEAEGLFAPERKRALPYLPRRIGVITSPSGAVIRDILHRLRDRFPREVLIWPVPVQGEECAPRVAAAIRGFNALAEDGDPPRPDVLIVARGGGSIEDLWGFNDEAVVRAAAQSAIPLISAVGHETDTTLIDHAADRRAPTPTAAAEMAVPVRLDLMAGVAALERRRASAMVRALGMRGQRLRDLARGLPRPDALMSERRQVLDGLGAKLVWSLRASTQRRRVRMGQGPSGRFGPPLLLLRLARARDRLGRTGDARQMAARLGQTLARRDETCRGLAARHRRAGGAMLRPARAQLDALSRMLDSLGPKSVLGRGYAIVRDGSGAVITRAAPARSASGLEIEFADGRVKTGAVRKGTKAKSPPDQGSLF